MSAAPRITDRERRELQQLVDTVEALARARQYGSSTGGFVEPVLVVESPAETLTATWVFPDGSQASFETTDCPLGPDLCPATLEDEVFDDDGYWVGADAAQPHLRFTRRAWLALTAVTAQVLYWRYRSGDYGSGVPGAAEYRLGREEFALTDAAVVSSERDLATSPGPLTVSMVGENHLGGE